MKKIVYLCGMMLLSINMMAQIDPNDRNWEVVVFDDFDQPNRQFDSTFQEPLGKWISFSPRLYPSGITQFGINKKTGDTIFYHQIYQWNQCIIDGSDGNLKLSSKFVRNTPIRCGELPPWKYCLPPSSFGKNYWCDPLHSKLYYHSGTIESLPGGYDKKSSNDANSGDEKSLPGRFRYGYFEIRCKLPVHRGAFPAFWLWDAQDSTYYETIDIFEYSWAFTDTAVYPNYQGELGSPRYYLNKIDYNHHEKCKVFPLIPNNEEDLRGWHIFSCVWLPERVTFYRDGMVTAEEKTFIPSHYLTLKTTYAIDRYAFHNYNSYDMPEWLGTDTMYVDYIKVYQLNWDCDTDELITCQSDLENFNFGVKKSISITASIEAVRVADTSHVTFRATDSFEITGPFQVESGGELTVIMQACPDANTDEKKHLKIR